MGAPRQFGLDALRALAVMLVVVAHGSVLAMPHVVPDRGIVYLAHLGVELFFVLSGFLVGGLLIDAVGKARPGDPRWIGPFWLRRWLRTLPSYYLILAANFALALALDSGWPADWPLYLVFSQNLAWAHPAFFGEAWSLAVEEWFYLLAPLLAFTALPFIRNARAATWALVAVLVAGLAVRIAVVLASDPAWDAGVRKIVVLRLDAIAYGVLMVHLLRSEPRVQINTGRLALVGIIVSAMAAALYFQADIDSDLLARTLMFSLCSLGCALLLPWAAQWQAPSWPPAFKSVFTRLALWSYAIYLVHMLVLRPMLAWLPERASIAAVGLQTVLYLALTLLLAAALYHGFEGPVLRWRDRRVPR
jgi:peptidoglycan/LPS O-acetylase OafA/YrhL